MSVARLRCIYAALVRPVWTYAIHLTPSTNEVEAMAAALLDSATKWIFPKLHKHSRCRMRRLLGIEDADITRRVQMRKMRARLQWARAEALEAGDMGEVVSTTYDDDMAALLVERDGGGQAPEDEQLQRWSQIEDSKSRRRKVAPATSISPHPLWGLPSSRHSVCAANWLLGRFPPNRDAVKWYLGEALYNRLDLQLRQLFIKAEWSNHDKERVARVLEVMTDFWPSPLKLFRTTQR